MSSLAKTIALEHGREGIRCNVVSPGTAVTPRIRSYFANSGRTDEFESAIPIGRLGAPADIASVVFFLCSDMASYVTGQTLLSDGGLSVKYPLPELDANPR